MHVNRTEAISRFLKSNAAPGLAELYRPGMEVQLNVQPYGTPVEGTSLSGHSWRGWRAKEGYVVKNVRIPWNAKKDPQFADSPLGWPIERHCLAVGMTGWSFNPCQSEFFVYDFDSMVGHASGLSQEELEAVKHRLMKLPFVAVRNSKSGLGIHCYVTLKEPVPTANHNEHAALARAILVQISQRAKFDFNASVDICGGNTWIWHKDAKKAGFKLLKQATTLLPAPKDWRDHLDLVSQTRKRPKPEGVSNSFYSVSGAHPPLDLEKGHKRLLDYLEESGAFYYWQPENNCLVTHTYSLTLAHEELQLKGPFSTVATGKDFQQDKNCFAFPVPNGGWVVRRFSQGTIETSDWDVDQSGWTRCYLNMEPKLSQIVGKTLEAAGKKGSFFASFSDLDHLNKRLGEEKIPSPHSIPDRDVQVKVMEGSVEFKMKKDPDEIAPEGWREGHGVFIKVITEDEDDSFTLLADMDEKIRCVVQDSSGVDDAPLFYGRNEDGSWNRCDSGMVTSLIAAKFEGNLNVRKEAIRSRPWRRVFRPFKDEYPGSRSWNMDPITYACEPEQGGFPTWDKLYEHVGELMGPSLEDNPWAKDHGIRTGKHYLQLWLAAILQFPECKLPYLYLWGEQQGGKSLFHESMNHLISTGGVVDASKALRGRYNAQIARAVVCVCDDMDLGKEKSDVYAKIKRWVTGLKITVEQKYMPIYETDNWTHFIHCNNPLEACPIFPGDTRITVVEVPGVKEKVAKHVMQEALREEAPYFLDHLLNLTIPSCTDRLRIPALGSEHKDSLIAKNETPVMTFIREFCIPCPGRYILFSDFISRFCEESGLEASLKSVSKQLDMSITRGRVSSEITKDKDGSTTETGHAIANFRWAAAPEPDPPLKYRWVLKNRYLKEQRTC